MVVQYIYTVFITAVLAAMLLENLIIFLLWKEYSTGVLGVFFAWFLMCMRIMAVASEITVINFTSSLLELAN